MIESLLADPWRSLQIAITLAAALVLLNRALRRLHAMCCCSPHSLRLAAVLMAAGAMAALLGAPAGAEDCFAWGQTLLLLGVALHVACDKRRYVRSSGALASLERQALAEPPPSRTRSESGPLQAAGLQ